tara:strand:+ start:552 stop:839 length:288 start_codon:yes stop_codon:yes gene_type:complete
MKAITNTLNTEHQEDSRYLKLLCEQKSDVVLKTEFGLGHYKFVEFKEYDGELVLEFQLMKDRKYKDTLNINQNIGSCCFLTIGQYLYAYSYNAFA